MECVICKLQYVGKSEWPMNIRLNNHRNDVHRTDGLEVCRHFQNQGHNFNKHAKITIIEELKDRNKPTLTMRKILEQREDFWIIKLQSLNPKGFNQGLNHPETYQ